MPRTRDFTDQIRSFNRFYTSIIGLLNKHILESPYSLSEVRILFEIYKNSTCTARQIKDSIKMDEGYLSRIVEKFVNDGLIKKTKSQRDARVYDLTLSTRGRTLFAKLNAASDKEVKNLIDGISRKDLERLVTCMNDIIGILSNR